MEQADLKIQIDLFDRFEGTPEFFHAASWEEVGRDSYRHRTHHNLSVRVHRHFFPTKKSHAALTERVEALLLQGKMVIISEHTGGNNLGDALLDLFERVNRTVPSEQNAFYLLAQSGRPPELFHQGNRPDPLLRLLHEGLGDVVPHREELADLLAHRMRCTKSSCACRAFNLSASSRWCDLKGEYRRWREEGSHGLSPIETLLDNFSFPYRDLSEVKFNNCRRSSRTP